MAPLRAFGKWKVTRSVMPSASTMRVAPVLKMRVGWVVTKFWVATIDLPFLSGIEWIASKLSGTEHQCVRGIPVNEKQYDWKAWLKQWNVLLIELKTNRLGDES